ncbi:MAG: DMT family transporter [Spirochaetaceae bacterium]
MKFINGRKSAIIGMLITALLWSTGGLFIKMVNGHPLAISSARAGIAGLFIWAYTGFKLVKPNKYMVLAAICYTVTLVGFVVSNKLTTAANAILIQYIAPVWVALLSWVILKERLRKSDIISIIILFIGLMMFFLEKLNAGMLAGNLIAIVTSISFAGFFITAKFLKHNEVIFAIIYGNLLTCIVGLPFYTQELFGTSSIMSLLFLGVIQIGLAYIFYSKSIIHLKALDAILIPMVEPLLNPVWVFLFIGELPSTLSLIGGIIVLSSVIGRGIYQFNKV